MVPSQPRGARGRDPSPPFHPSQPPQLTCASHVLDVGKVFAPLLFVWLVGGFLIIAGATAAVVVMPQVCSRVLCTVRVASMDKQGEDSLHRVAVRLFCASTLYYACVWLTSLVIIGLYWANGSVFDSPQWRAYGAQAIILHISK